MNAVLVQGHPATGCGAWICSDTVKILIELNKEIKKKKKNNVCCLKKKR